MYALLSTALESERKVGVCATTFMAVVLCLALPSASLGGSNPKVKLKCSARAVREQIGTKRRQDRSPVVFPQPSPMRASLALAQAASAQPQRPSRKRGRGQGACRIHAGQRDSESARPGSSHSQTAKRGQARLNQLPPLPLNPSGYTNPNGDAPLSGAWHVLWGPTGTPWGRAEGCTT